MSLLSTPPAVDLLQRAVNTIIMITVLGKGHIYPLDSPIFEGAFGINVESSVGNVLSSYMMNRVCFERFEI